MRKTTASLRAFAIICALFIASGCSSISVDDYETFEPVLSPEEFFTGNLTAHGVVKDRGGKVIRMFNADITTNWSDGVGTLDEYFLFNDGDQQRRIWTLQPTGAGQYNGTAGDVRGQGKLTHAGNSIFLDYVLSVPFNDGAIDVRVDDRMYQVAPGILINESVMTKFGVRVGSILLVILREDALPLPAAYRVSGTVDESIAP